MVRHLTGTNCGSTQQTNKANASIVRSIFELIYKIKWCGLKILMHYFYYLRCVNHTKFAVSRVCVREIFRKIKIEAVIQTIVENRFRIYLQFFSQNSKKNIMLRERKCYKNRRKKT